MAESHYPIEQFKPTKWLTFPTRQFVSKSEGRNCCAKWCDTFFWLHYDINQDAAFCYMCMQCKKRE